MEKKLEVKNLQISFRTQGGILKAVRDISFDLYKGETLAIVGESGSGKSVTSKAIIGILAGNSIVEGGEILYDGQDLLKINEDDFHKIRGDKIAMIFQDPLSSLNPIMRVGQQLTEAMILKTKTSRRNARHNFNTKLKLLNVNANEVTTDQDHQNVQKHKEDIKIFDDFCVQGTRLERVYNEAIAELIGLQLTIDNVLFLIEKKQKIDLAKQFKEINRAIKASVHPFVLIVDEEVAQSQQDLDNLRKLRKKIPVADAVTVLKKLSKIVNETAL
ncbi:MAG: ATP-binding cassette domain-containing protein, partial [Bacilli bacterium]